MTTFSVIKIMITLIILIFHASSATVYPGLIYLGRGSDASSRNIRPQIVDGKPLSTSAYYVSRNRETWYDAIVFCREETDGELLSLETPEENELVHDLVMQHENFATIWTAGAFNSSSTRSWVWATTGSEVKYTNWGYDEPRLSNKISRIAIKNDISSNGWFWMSATSSALYHYICEIEESPQPVKCFGKNDIVFVLNSSKYVGTTNFMLGKDFVALMSSAFAYPNRVSFIVYAKSVGIILPLNSNMSLDGKQKLIRDATWKENKQGSMTHKAILAAVSELTTSEAGVARKIVVLTSRPSHILNETIMAAKSARDVGIKLYSVGIGKLGQSKTEELGMIAGGVAENVFTTGDFKSLKKLSNMLSVRLCDN